MYYIGDTQYLEDIADAIRTQVQSLPSASGIKIRELPRRMGYSTGETFDSTGMKVVAMYGSGQRDVTAFCTFTPSTIASDTTTIVVSYTENNITYTANLNIMRISSIETVSLPTKTQYRTVDNDVLDLTGLSIQAYYTDGTDEEITDYCDIYLNGNIYNNEVLNTAGTYIASIKYGSWGATYNIVVNLVTENGIVVVSSVSEIVQSDNVLDPNLINVYISYSDGTTGANVSTESILLVDDVYYELVPLNEVKTYTITAIYINDRATCEINVVAS